MFLSAVVKIAFAYLHHFNHKSPGYNVIKRYNISLDIYKRNVFLNYIQTRPSWLLRDTRGDFKEIVCRMVK